MNKFAYMLLLSACVYMAFVSCGTKETGSTYATEIPDSVNHYIYDSGVLRLVATSDSTSEIQHLMEGKVVSTWPLDYEVYRFDCGDVTGDGMPEVLVGTVKKTRYRPVMDRRLFIFHLHNGRDIRPLWLGSRVSRPLIDFCVERDTMPNLIHTWEREGENDTVQILYRHKGFGLKFYKYL